MEFITILSIILILSVAFIISPLGLGGGVLYVPILHYMLGWHLEEALLGSLTLVLMVAIGSSLAHKKGGYADKALANKGRISAIPGAIIGPILGWMFITYIDEMVIKVIAALILVFVIERTIRRSIKESKTELPPVDRKSKLTSYRFGTMFAATIAGLLGIGGGAILVMIHRSLIGMDVREAAGTSYLIEMTIIPIALLTHIIIDGSLPGIIETNGLLPLILIPLLACGCAVFGAKFSIAYVPRKYITTAFITAVSISLIRYIIDFANLL
jgi:uncharacterized membrane protein YfcA